MNFSATEDQKIGYEAYVYIVTESIFDKCLFDQYSLGSLSLYLELETNVQVD